MTRYYISVDVGGTNCRVGLMEKTDESLKVISQKKFKIQKDFEEGVKELAAHINLLKKGFKIEGVGAGFPTSVNSENGIINDATNLPGWNNQPVVKRLEELTQLKTYIFHDVALAAAGEALYGQGVSEDKFVFFIWGTGVGGAKVEKLQGKLHITSFEPGHFIADPKGDRCICGQIGCPEQFIGGASLEHHLNKVLGEISDDDLIWTKVSEIAGQTVATIQAFHPTPLIIFGGGIILRRPFLLKKIKSYLQKNLFIYEVPELKISQLGDDAALYGAVALQEVEQI